MRPSEALTEAAYALSVKAPDAWADFVKAYQDHAVLTCMAAVRAPASDAEAARGGAQLALKQAETFSEIRAEYEKILAARMTAANKRHARVP